jgi:hypothetical protein
MGSRGTEWAKVGATAGLREFHGAAEEENVAEGEDGWGKGAEHDHGGPRREARSLVFLLEKWCLGLEDSSTDATLEDSNVEVDEHGRLPPRRRGLEVENVSTEGRPTRKLCRDSPLPARQFQGVNGLSAIQK